MKLTLHEQFHQKSLRIRLLQAFLFLYFLTGIQIKSNAQFSGDFAIANWTYSSTTPGGDGSINTTGAPSTIVLRGSDNNTGFGSNFYEQYIITIPTTGSISFDYVHVNPDLDDAYYKINGSQIFITGSGSGTRSNISVTAGNTFGFMVYNQDNCCGRGILTISNFVFTPASPVISVQPVNQSPCNGATATFSITASNATSYQWQENSGSGFSNISNGGNYSGATTTTLSIANVGTGLNGYIYRCIATGSISPAATSNSANLTANAAITATTSQTNVSCNGGTNGSASVTATGGTGTYTYLWSGGGTASTKTSLSVGSYTCTITDASSCSATKTFSITQPSTLTATTAQTNVSCNGGSNGTASVTPSGGTSSYTYNWTPGNPTGDGTSTVTGLTAGSWSCTVTDVNGCVVTKAYTLTEPSVISASTSQINIACNGNTTGSASVIAGGGTSPYTYQWSPSGGTSATATGLLAGTYLCTITDANACTLQKSFTLTQPAPLFIAAAQTNVSCNGGSNGSAQVVVSGGTSSYSYTWSGGGTSSSKSGLSAGNYTCTITDANSCTSTQSFTVTQPSGITYSTSQTNVSCNGGSNGSAIVTASGGTSPYTYLWSGGGTSSVKSGLTAGSHTCTITDANSCTQVVNFTITQPAVLNATTTQINIACNAGATGSATVIATGGTVSYTYSWSGGGSAATKNNLLAGIYTCTITDANSCTVAKVFTITQPVVLSAATTQTNIACNGNSNGSASVIASGGTSPYTYQWSPSGGTSATANGLSAGTYTCTITDANSCVLTKNYTLTQPTLLAASTSQTNISCFGGSNGNATVLPSGGTPSYTYQWSGGGNAASNTGLSCGAFTCTVTDANGCSLAKQIVLTQPAVIVQSISQTNISCNGSNDGTASVQVSGGTSPYNYLWSTSEITDTITGLNPGTVSVTITDNNGCTMNSSVQITEPNPLSFAVYELQPSCYGSSNGELAVSTVGGTMPFTYSWSNGVTDTIITGIYAGTYSVSVTDQNGCQLDVYYTLYEPDLITSNLTADTVSCFGLSDGSASANPAGGTAPYTFLWSNGATTSAVSGLNAQVISVLITDDHGCTQSDYINITEPLVLSATSQVTNVSCNGSNDGLVVLTPTGGTTPYAYQWVSGGNSATEMNLPAGSYTALITDDHGCSYTQNIIISEPDPLNAGLNATHVSCYGLTDGAIISNTTGGTLPYSYIWSNGDLTSMLSGLVAGTYNLIVTDSNGCNHTDSIEIIQPNLLFASNISFPVACNGGADGEISIQTFGGTQPYYYLWSDGSVTDVHTNLNAGNYSVTVTDDHGCEFMQSITMTEPSPLIGQTTIVNANCGQSNGSASISVSGGIGNYTFLWMNGDTTSVSNNLSSGNYSVSITDQNGCSISEVASVSDIGAPVISINQTDVSCFGGTNGSVDIIATGTGLLSFYWNSTVSNSIISGLSAGTYSYQVIDSANCQTTGTVVINQPDSINVSAAVQNELTGQDGSIDLAVNGGTAGYTFLWSNGEVSEDLNGLFAGDYTVTVTDLNGCTNQLTVTVSSSVGIHDISGNGPEITVFPNPNNGNFIVVGAKDDQLSLYSEIGQLITTANLNGTNMFTVKIENLANGIYYMRSNLMGNNWFKKVIVIE